MDLWFKNKRQEIVDRYNSSLILQVEQGNPRSRDSFILSEEGMKGVH